jgi:hypothetical protein
MDLELTRKFIDQAILMAMNYYFTGREDKSAEILNQVRKIEPDNALLGDLWEYIFGISSHRSVDDAVGIWWNGESLSGKSIQVICDQGMGDTIQMLRYLKKLRDDYNCDIIVNCYAYHNELVRIMDEQDYIESFNTFPVKCDYFVNILSVPLIMNKIKLDRPYPAHFNYLLNTPIPPQPHIGQYKSWLRPEGFKVGLAWHSNLENSIGIKKSISLDRFAILEDGVNEMFSLIPSQERVNFMVQLPNDNLYDTACIIQGCDVIVSVDTVSLHLAASMGKKVLGILPHQADARWALDRTTVWYPSVELFRQPENLDWEQPIKEVKERLVELRSMR